MITASEYVSRLCITSLTRLITAGKKASQVASQSQQGPTLAAPGSSSASGTVGPMPFPAPSNGTLKAVIWTSVPLCPNSPSASAARAACVLAQPLPTQLHARVRLQATLAPYLRPRPPQGPPTGRMPTTAASRPVPWRRPSSRPLSRAASWLLAFPTSLFVELLFLCKTNVGLGCLALTAGLPLA